MKKFKPNLKKMFNFHTIILVLIFVVVSTLNSHTIEGKLPTNHKHHTQQHHNHNHHQQQQQQHNVIEGGDGVGDLELESKQQHHNHKQHSHHHHHDHNATPSLEFTTSSSVAASSSSFSSSSSSTVLISDNEFLIKPEQQQEQPPLIHKDDEEIYYKTKDLKSYLSSSQSSSSSTTSKPSSLSIQLIKKSNLQNSNSRREHTHPNNHQHHSHNHHQHIEHYQRLKQTAATAPLTKHPGGDIETKNFNNHHDDTQATMYPSVTNKEHKNSKWNLATIHDKVPAKFNEHDYYDREKKPDLDSDRRLRQQHHQQHQNYEDYYSDDDDEDDEYNEDEGDNDGISYDDDKNLSDRSYARITRSKLDDDYIDDEPYRNELQNDAPGVLTDRKYSEVGNEKAVQQARERYLQEQKRPRTPHELATEHWQRMIQATKCRKPMPRVIPVSNNTSKRYEPYATILHRCGDDTGCCGSTASVCTVKRQEIVMIYVFSYDFNYRKEIEALPMQNHTECHCVNRASLLHDYMPRGKRSGGSGRIAAAAVGGLGLGSSSTGNTNYLQHFQRSQNKKEHQLQQQQQQYQQQFQHHEQQLQNMLDCHCPRHFNVFEEDVERHAHLPKPHSVFIRKCRCDCLVNNQTCLRFKHGEEGFSLEDRKCILDRNCKPPVCSYGEYNLRVGRCPSSRPHLPQMT